MKDLKVLAAQLRKPSGEMAQTTADKMSVVNRSLYDLTLSHMNISADDCILEIGFGGGEHLEDFLNTAAGVQIRGIDYSDEMVARASANNSDFLETGHLRLFTGNSNNMPFRDGSFDKVFCNMVIYFWEKPAEHLAEVQRVLKPGGKFYTGMRPRESMLKFPFTRFGFQLHTETEWVRILEKNGFVVEGVKHQFDPAAVDKEKFLMKADKEDVRLESVCIIARKQT